MAISQIYDMSARQVWVGRYDEHGSREVAWDVSPWTSKLGSDGVFALLVTRPRDTDSPYNAQVSFDASTNLVTWAVTDVDTALKGWGRAELHYYVDGALVKSQTFVTIIEKAMFAGSTAPSAAEGWVERMEQAALDARAAAETAEDAETTATSAATTATSAAATAITAANSASSSASSARADATTATNAATAAALSKSAASTSATNAAASAEAASTSALTASTAASTATTKASQASASASTAATAATTATNKASEATTAAQTATTKAGEASTSASTATSAKDTAVSAARTATTKATEATTAAATATSAATTATTAKDDAVSAKTAAQTAQTGAETAAASVQSSAEQIATNAEDISQLKSELTHKANQDGYYADLVSGGSTQLLSDMVETDTTPYNYRTAGGSLEIGDRMKLKKIVGGSLAVNQLVQNGNFSDGTTCWSVNNGTVTASDGKLTFSPNAATSGKNFGGNNAQPTFIIAGHKYFFSFYAKVSTTEVGGDFSYDILNDSTIRRKALTENVDTRFNGVVTTQASNRLKPFFYPWGTASVTTDGTEQAVVHDVQVHDLTAMFGTTIADYVYGLETATAGAGVAWLKAHFPRIFDAGYIPYNAGTLEHVSGLSAHKMVGFNQWDEEWESGSYNSLTGEKQADSSKIRCKNLIEILPNTVYYKYCGAGDTKMYWNVYYDANGNYLSRSGSNANGTFTTPNDAYYMSFNCESTYGTTYKNDICINLHWDGERDGEYEPYEEHSYPLDSDVTLRGIPKLDANNNLYYDGDEYEADGTVTRRYGIVDLGTLTWEAASAYGNVYRSGANLPDAVNGNRSMGQQAPIILSTSAFKNSYNVTDAAQVATAGLIGINYNKVYATFAESMTAAQIKTALSGVYMLYTLKNAYITTESADPYTEIQNVSNWGTEEFVTTSLVPVGHETEYQPDLRAKIEVAPESPDTDGLYLMKRENGQNSYVAYLGELPSDPTTDGTYTLKCTVASGTATKTWEADT